MIGPGEWLRFTRVQKWGITFKTYLVQLNLKEKRIILDFVVWLIQVFVFNDDEDCVLVQLSLNLVVQVWLFLGVLILPLKPTFKILRAVNAMPCFQSVLKRESTNLGYREPAWPFIVTIYYRWISFSFTHFETDLLLLIFLWPMKGLPAFRLDRHTLVLGIPLSDLDWWLRVIDYHIEWSYSCDLGVYVFIMSYSLFRKVGGGVTY